jgi:hypothetical protein
VSVLTRAGKYAGIAAALVLLALVLAVGSGRRPPAEAAESPDERAGSLESEALDTESRESFDEGGYGELAEGTLEVEALERGQPPDGAATPAPASDPSGSGLVAGALLLSDGTPVPNVWISFVDPARDYVVAKRSHACTDEHGFYEIRLGAQRWNVWYLGARRSGYARPCGSIDVAPDAVVHWDVVLEGSRTLRGELVVAAEDLSDMGEDEAQPLLIEVRRPGGREVLGQCEALTTLARERDADPELEDGPAAAPAGSFEIEALPAELLELRIVLPGGYRHPLTGLDHEMYLVRTVDLHAGDVVLPREVLRMRDFFEATMQRLLKEER